MLFRPTTDYENALSFSRFDESHLLSTCSAHQFDLDGERWLSVEHYYQASKFSSDYQYIVKSAESPREAHRLGNKWLKRKRADFNKLRPILMTRALYSKAIQNQEVKEFLLDSAKQKIAETSLYDPFWGIARDQRGQNHLGKIWMDIRTKLSSKHN